MAATPALEESIGVVAVVERTHIDMFTSDPLPQSRTRIVCIKQSRKKAAGMRSRKCTDPFGSLPPPLLPDTEVYAGAFAITILC